MENPTIETPETFTDETAESAPEVDELEAFKARNAELEKTLADIRAIETRKAVSDAFIHAAQERGIGLNDEALEVFDWTKFADGDSVNIADIAAILDLFQTRPKFPQNLGIGRQGGNGPYRPSPVSRDARDRQ
ncbi:hypothetical protein ACIBEJ_13920 [Nonomuraea sp. NPDC050790]|uniref:hypothetical protein n=1 Tax=Nonomuraea sp. NPDC050790 TaxID=3364371 RepID=UPI003791BB68